MFYKWSEKRGLVSAPLIQTAMAAGLHAPGRRGRAWRGGSGWPWALGVRGWPGLSGPLINLPPVWSGPFKHIGSNATGDRGRRTPQDWKFSSRRRRDETLDSDEDVTTRKLQLRKCLKSVKPSWLLKHQSLNVPTPTTWWSRWFYIKFLILKFRGAPQELNLSKRGRFNQCRRKNYFKIKNCFKNRQTL